MNELTGKRQKIMNDLRKKNREDIRNSIRDTILSKLNSTERPIISDVLTDFVDCTHWQLCQESQSLLSVIQSTNLAELDDEAHYFFVTDLYYLLHENIITLPPGMRFKKNEESYTASLVAMAANDIDEDELAYWADFMNDEAKEIMFLSMSIQELSHAKWVKNAKLFAILLESIKWMETAAATFKQLLMFSEEISKKQIDSSVPYVQSALEMQLQKSDISFRRILTEVWITEIRIYAKLQFHNDRVKEMIGLLKRVIGSNIDILLSSSIIQDLNQLYEAIREDFLQNDSACELLLLSYAKSLEMGNEQLVNEDQSLFRNYLFRLFHNNWRAKKLLNRSFQYPQSFYALLSKVNRGDKQNPFFEKLVNIQQK